jgi:hypothetical protein
MLAPTAISAVHRYWASFFGVPTNGGLRICAEPCTLNAVHVAGVTFARIPPEMAAPVAEWPPAQLCDLTAFSQLPITIRAHASLAYADAGALVAPGPGVTALAGDDARIAELATTMSADEWDECGLWRGTALQGWHAVVVDGQVAAAAAYENWGGDIAHLCVATARAYRCQARGRQAAAASAHHAVASGLVAQWRASMPNAASRAVGARLGFLTLGEQLVLSVQRAASSASERNES